MLDFSVQERRFVLFLLGSFLIGCAVNLYRQTQSSSALSAWHIQQNELAQKINSMPGIHPERAATTQPAQGVYLSNTLLQRKNRLITKINLNNASSEEMQQLEGIGPALASRIIAFREANNGFSSIEQLQQVKGIGPKTLARIRDRVCVK